MKKLTIILLFASFLLFSKANQLNAQDKDAQRAEWKEAGLRGYKGFVTVGGGTGDVEIGDRSFNNNFFIELETTHGYQFNPWLFAGGGVGSQGFTESDKIGEDGFVTSNIFGAVRFNWLNHKITPFLEGKVGLSIPYSGEIADDLTTGVYASPSIGCHFGIGRKYSFRNAGIHVYGYHEISGK